MTLTRENYFLNLYRNNTYIFIYLLFVVIFQFEFFSHLMEIGVVGSDSAYYFRVAEDWAKGDYYLPYHYRPLSYIVFSFFIDIFDYANYSIKIFNGLITLFTSFIILLLLKNEIPKNDASVISGIYLIMPLTLALTRGELMTPFLTFLFYLHIYTLYKAYKTNNVNWVMFSFFVLGMSFNVHRTFLFILPFTIVSVLYVLKNFNLTINKVGFTLLASLLFFLIPIIIPMYIWGFYEVISSFQAKYTIAGAMHRISDSNGYLESWLVLNEKLFDKVSGSFIHVSIYFISIVFVIISSLFNRSIRLVAIFNLVLQFLMLTWLILILNYPMERHFYSFVMLIVINFYITFAYGLNFINKTYLLPLTMVSLFIVVPRINYLPFLSYSEAQFNNKNSYQYVFLDFAKEMKSVTTNKDKILILPLAYPHQRGVLSLQAYLGNNAVYASFEAEDKQFIASEYDYIALLQAYTWMRNGKKRSQVLADNFYKMKLYTRKKEKMFVQKIMQEQNAKKIIQKKHYTVWKVNK